MRAVALPGTDLAPSRLGFGTASLMARLSLRQSLRLLEVAHENGITHFDTARSYGYGETERAVGAFVAGRRDDVTVATKLGILPPRRSPALRAAKTVARIAARLPAARSMLRRRAEAMIQGGRFEPSEARSSLETSLRELRTETVDVLLLHECTPEDLATEGLLDFLQAVVREGKVRYFGVATSREATRAILDELPEFAGVVQLGHSALDPELDQLPLRGAAVVTHSAVRPLLGELTQLMREERRRERWSRELAVDCASPQVLGRLLLADALRSNDRGVVLFSSTDEERVRSNAALADGEEFSREQLDRFAGLVRAEAGERR